MCSTASLRACSVEYPSIIDRLTRPARVPRSVKTWLIRQVGGDVGTDTVGIVVLSSLVVYFLKLCLALFNLKPDVTVAPSRQGTT